RDAGPLPFVQEQDLQGVVARQPLGRVDVQPIQGADGCLLAQPFPGRAEQRAATVALLPEAGVGRPAPSVRVEACRPRLDRAADRAGRGLLLRRDAGVEGDPQGRGRHHCRPPVVATRATRFRLRVSRGADVSGDGAAGWTPGRTCSSACASRSSRRRVGATARWPVTDGWGWWPFMASDLRAGRSPDADLCDMPPGVQPWPYCG